MLFYFSYISSETFFLIFTLSGLIYLFPLSISSVLFLSAHICTILIHLFDASRGYLPHNTFLFSQSPHLQLISRFVLSLFCRISSRCTNRTQSIHPPPYLASLPRTSIPTTTLDSDPPISQRCYPYHIHSPPSSTLSLLVGS